MVKILRHIAPYILLCSLSMAQSMNTQQTAHAGFSPVPIWPQNGILPDTLREQYVFLDPAKNEVVLNVPEGPANNASRKQIRFNLHREVEPLISVHIQPAGEQLSYSYSITNGPHANNLLKRLVYSSQRTPIYRRRTLSGKPLSLLLRLPRSYRNLILNTLFNCGG